MVKSDILENEVIDLGSASAETKGGSIAGVDDNQPGQRYSGGGIQDQD